MALGQTNISVAVVQSAIGVTSTSSVGGLIAKAASGGVGGYAFYINETYGTTGYRNGYLISGAAPHWNMWSNSIPAEWDYSNGTMELRLKRNALNPNGGYDFRLHDFRGYDHNAVQPQLSVATTFNFTGGVGDISWLAHFHQIKMPADITHILVKVTIGAQVKTYNMPLADIIDSTPSIQGYTLNFTGVSETSGTLQLFASNAQATEVATLGNIVSTRSFTVNHVSQYAYLSRQVAAPQDDYVTLFGNITVPSGSGSIQLAAGTTTLSGITIRFTASSQYYDTIYFDLYLAMQGETDTYVGSYYVSADAMPINTDLTDIYVELPQALIGGDQLAFKVMNMTY